MSDVRMRKQELIFKVVVNHEEQYSLWPADRENKRGWRDEGFRGIQEECTRHIGRSGRTCAP